jgi:hypothetical protein
LIDATMRLLHASLLAFLGAFGTATATAASFASSPCVANDAATPASCAELARKLSHDIDSVRALWSGRRRV